MEEWVLDAVVGEWKEVNMVKGRETEGEAVALYCTVRSNGEGEGD